MYLCCLIFYKIHSTYEPYNFSDLRNFPNCQMCVVSSGIQLWTARLSRGDSLERKTLSSAQSNSKLNKFTVNLIQFTLLVLSVDSSSLLQYVCLLQELKQL